MIEKSHRPSAGAAAGRLGLRDYLLVAAAATALMFFALGGDSLNSHEAKVAVCARNMAGAGPWLSGSDSSVAAISDSAVNRWLVPVFNGHVRLNKTPLAYWLVAALLKCGLPVNDIVVRVPTAAASVIMTLIALATAGRLFGRRAALISAAAFATSCGVQDWGRLACVDMTMCVFITLAMLIFYAVIFCGKSRWWLLAGGVMLGAGSLAKQFVPLIALWPMGLMLCWQSSGGANAGVAESGADKLNCGNESGSGKQAKLAHTLFNYAWIATLSAAVFAGVRALGPLQWWGYLGISESVGIAVTAAAALFGPAVWYVWPWRRNFFSWLLAIAPVSLIALVLCLAMFVPWMLWLMDIFPRAEEVFAHQNGSRALGVDGWADHGSRLFYGYYIWMLLKWLLPWTPVLLAAAAKFLKTSDSSADKRFVFLWLWIFGYFIILTLGGGKHSHYILPAVFPAALLIGVYSDYWLANNKTTAAGVLSGVFKLLVAAAILTAATAGIAGRFVGYPLGGQLDHICVIALVSLLPLILGYLRCGAGNVNAAICLLIAAATLGAASYNAGLSRWHVKWADYQRMGRHIKELVPAGRTLRCLYDVSPPVVYYSGMNIEYIRRKSELLLPENGSQLQPRPWVLATQADADFLMSRQYAAAHEYKIHSKKQRRIVFIPQEDR